MHFSEFKSAILSSVNPSSMDIETFFGSSSQNPRYSEKPANLGEIGQTEQKDQLILKVLKPFDYAFLDANQRTIALEIETLLETLQERKGDTTNSNDIVFWQACYVYCSLLVTFYSKEYYNHSKLHENYLQKANDIAAFLQNSAPKPIIGESNFIIYFKKELKSEIKKISKLVKDPHYLHDWIGVANVYRLLLAFGRISMRTLALASKSQLQWLSQIGKVTHQSTDVNHFISNINATAHVFNALSLAFFGGRLLLNISEAVKHAFFPTQMEQANTKGKMHRFLKEIDACKIEIINDVAWNSVNLIANYGSYLHIAPMVGFGLTSGFLVFDIAIFAICRRRKEKEYQDKENELRRLLENLNTEMSKTTIQTTKSNLNVQLEITQSQLTNLMIERKSVNDKFYFNILAASLLFAGFTAGFLLAVPAATACFLVCTVAIAMYLSSGDFQNYRKAHYKVEAHKNSNSPQPQKTGLIASRDQARNKFMKAMLINTAMPLLLVTIFAICWQAAVLLTALCLTAAFCQGFFKQKRSESQTNMALAHAK